MLSCILKHRNSVYSIFKLSRRTSGSDVFKYTDIKENIKKSSKIQEKSVDYQVLLNAAKENVTHEKRELALKFTELSKKFHYPTTEKQRLNQKKFFDDENEPIGLAKLFLSDNSKITAPNSKLKVSELEYKRRLVYEHCLSQENPAKLSLGGQLSFEEFSNNKYFKPVLDFGKHSTTDSLTEYRFAMIKCNDNIRFQARKINAKKKRETDILPKRGACIGVLFKGFQKQIHQQKYLTASLFNQPIIIDLRYAVNAKALSSLEIQLNAIIGSNKTDTNPFHIILANCKNSDLSGHLKTSVVNLDNSHTVYKDNYLKMDDINKEDIIYLSPDAKEDMQEFDHNKIYVIGGIVDQCPVKLISSTVAYHEKVNTQRFPLQKYLKWGGSSSSLELTLHKSFEILQILRQTNSDWLKALSCLPIRLHRGLSLEGKVLANYDPEIIKKFDISDDVFKKHQKRFKPSIYEVKSPSANAGNYLGHFQ